MVDNESICIEKESVCTKKKTMANKPAKRRRQVFTEKVLEKVTFNCEWDNCSQLFNKIKDYITHVNNHLSFIDQSSGKTEVMCEWKDCNFSSIPSMLKSHVSFHAFHCKIKALGDAVMREADMQCVVGSSQRNVIPEVPATFKCLWHMCGEEFFSIQDFYWHVDGHIFHMSESSLGCDCKWKDCNIRIQNKSILKRHIRIHTKEKIVGCSNCGSIFSANRRLVDHLQRQIPIKSEEFKCPYCAKHFATDSLRQMHVHYHIDKVKCPHCDATCTSDQTLKRHIKFRHSDRRDFLCKICFKGFKMKYDLKKHLLLHSEESPYKCSVIGCDLSFRNKLALSLHVREEHQDSPAEPYKCHLCGKCFRIGPQLTVHLTQVHQLGWPAGHTRFRYQQGEDGYYELQTSRKLTQELWEEIKGEEIEKNS